MKGQEVRYRTFFPAVMEKKKKPVAHAGYKEVCSGWKVFERRGSFFYPTIAIRGVEALWHPMGGGLGGSPSDDVQNRKMRVGGWKTITGGGQHFLVLPGGGGFFFLSLQVGGAHQLLAFGSVGGDGKKMGSGQLLGGFRVSQGNRANRNSSPKPKKFLEGPKRNGEGRFDGRWGSRTNLVRMEQQTARGGKRGERWRVLEVIQGCTAGEKKKNWLCHPAQKTSIKRKKRRMRWKPPWRGLLMEFPVCRGNGGKDG